MSDNQKIAQNLMKLKPEIQGSKNEEGEDSSQNNSQEDKENDIDVSCSIEENIKTLGYFSSAC